MDDSSESIALDIAAIAAIGAVPSVLKIICQSTGMGFAAVARVTEGSWTACAVQDDIAFGLKPGGQLPVQTTLCIESRAALQPIVFDHASEDPKFRDHHTPRLYNIQSYISVPIVMPDGRYFGNLCAIDPLPRAVSEAETVAMFVGFANLIALQLAEEQRTQAVAADLFDERANSQLRENFIAVLGHDLRTPLSSIAMTAEVLCRSPSMVNQAVLGERLRSASARMSRLIDDVLDLTRGRLGGGIAMAIAHEPALEEWLEDVLAELRTAHPQRLVNGRIVVGQPVQGDRVRLQQLLSNLVGNALTYGSPEHSVEVDVSVSDGFLVISVHNFGEPIPADTHTKVFEPYWRSKNRQPEGGLGLGLFICAEISKGHGGDIKLTSSRKDGTRFTARIPV